MVFDAKGAQLQVSVILVVRTKASSNWAPQISVQFF